MRATHLWSLLLIGALAACGSVKESGTDDARPPDDAPAAVDAPVAIDAPAAIDAGIDAGVDAPPPPPGQELTGGAGRVTGTTYAMDVELGHPFSQRPLDGTTYHLQSNTPIKP